jgi:hypothetical protein
MIDIKFKTDKAKDKFKRLPNQIKRTVSSESEKIKVEVWETTLPNAPVYKDVLRNSILYEGVPFERISETKIRQTLRYDAYNPNTGFHYGLLRHEQTTTGKPYWAKTGMQESVPLVEKIIINAVKRGVRSW